MCALNLSVNSRRWICKMSLTKIEKSLFYHYAYKLFFAESQKTGDSFKRFSELPSNYNDLLNPENLEWLRDCLTKETVSYDYYWEFRCVLHTVNSDLNDMLDCKLDEQDLFWYDKIKELRKLEDRLTGVKVVGIYDGELTNKKLRL